jgi:hypothetical protein
MPPTQDSRDPTIDVIIEAKANCAIVICCHLPLLTADFDQHFTICITHCLRYSFKLAPLRYLATAAACSVLLLRENVIQNGAADD